MKAVADTLPVSKLQADGSVLFAIWPAKECACGKMAAFLVNRHGKTRCLDCDIAYRKERE